MWALGLARLTWHELAPTGWGQWDPSRLHSNAARQEGGTCEYQELRGWRAEAGQQAPGQGGISGILISSRRWQAAGITANNHLPSDPPTVHGTLAGSAAAQGQDVPPTPSAVCGSIEVCLHCGRALAATLSAQLPQSAVPACCCPLGVHLNGGLHDPASQLCLFELCHPQPWQDGVAAA